MYFSASYFLNIVKILTNLALWSFIPFKFVHLYWHSLFILDLIDCCYDFNFGFDFAHDFNWKLPLLWLTFALFIQLFDESTS